MNSGGVESNFYAIKSQFCDTIKKWWVEKLKEITKWGFLMHNNSIRSYIDDSYENLFIKKLKY